MPREVMEAMIEANDYFVDMYELTEAAGKRVAEVVGAEAALVTSGAFSAMILGAAACLTGTDPEKIDALPHRHGRSGIVSFRPHTVSSTTAPTGRRE